MFITTNPDKLIPNSEMTLGLQKEIINQFI